MLEASPEFAWRWKLEELGWGRLLRYRRAAPMSWLVPGMLCGRGLSFGRRRGSRHASATLNPMTKVGVDTLKDQLDDYLKRAGEGERILITERGRSVALLIPIESSKPVHRAWDLVESGVATWSGGKPIGSRQRPRVRGMSASDIVLEDRR